MPTVENALPDSFARAREHNTGVSASTGGDGCPQDPAHCGDDVWRRSKDLSPWEIPPSMPNIGIVGFEFSTRRWT